jgi:hypothetical protein
MSRDRAEIEPRSSRDRAEIAPRSSREQTCLDLLPARSQARVYKHAGHASAAARWMEEARKMDLADRYLNTKATELKLIETK